MLPCDHSQPPEEKRGPGLAGGEDIGHTCGKLEMQVELGNQNRILEASEKSWWLLDFDFSFLKEFQTYKKVAKIVQRSPVYPSARFPRDEHFAVLLLSPLHRHIRMLKNYVFPGFMCTQEILKSFSPSQRLPW